MRSLWRRLFPPGPDFVGLVCRQLELTLQAVEAMEKWFQDLDDASAQEVYRLENEADGARRELVVALSQAFETPLDREDMNDLSNHIDDVVDSARAAVRQGQSLQLTPNGELVQMVGNIKQGIVELTQAVRFVRADRPKAVTYAGKARHAMRLNERIYAEATATLFSDHDFRHVLRQREMFRRVLEITEALSRAAGELDHAIHKLG